jgi:hypothetical protein
MKSIEAGGQPDHPAAVRCRIRGLAHGEMGALMPLGCGAPKGFSMPQRHPMKAFPVSWDMFHRDARALAWRLSEVGPFDAIVCITRGGLVPAAIVARVSICGSSRGCA